MTADRRDAAAKMRLSITPKRSLLRSQSKRGFDLLLAMPMLALAAPIIGVAAILIRIESTGSAIFVQQRIGRHGAHFRLFKLRTMSAGVGPPVTARGDRRITRVGRVLRRTRIDELPQLWNVVRGDMSIIGPRPEHADFVAHYRDEWKELLTVRPGLTDPATIAFADEEALLRGVAEPAEAYVNVIMPAKARISLDGLRQDSLFADVKVLAQTAAAVVAPRRSSGLHPAFTEAQSKLSVSATRAAS